MSDLNTDAKDRQYARDQENTEKFKKLFSEISRIGNTGNHRDYAAAIYGVVSTHRALQDHLLQLAYTIILSLGQMKYTDGRNEHTVREAQELLEVICNSVLSDGGLHNFSLSDQALIEFCERNKIKEW